MATHALQVPSAPPPGRGPSTGDPAASGAAPADTGGALLRYDRAWTQWAYVAAVLIALCAFAFCCTFNVYEYAGGPAVVRVDGKRTITTPAAGVVENFAVRPGQFVKQNELLVRLHDADEVAELNRVKAEYEQQLIRLMLNPAETSAKTQLAALAARRDQAAARLNERRVRAPIAGTVSDIRIRPGQKVDAGEVLLGVSPPDANVSIVAVLPGDYRPMLSASQPLRFSLDGYAYEYHDLSVESVGDGVVGPSEVKRFLGQEIFDSVRMTTGAKVLLTARLSSKTFSSEGQTYAFYDGLTGTAEVRVRDEPIIVTLLPFLKALAAR